MKNGTPFVVSTVSLLIALTILANPARGDASITIRDESRLDFKVTLLNDFGNTVAEKTSSQSEASIDIPSELLGQTLTPFKITVSQLAGGEISSLPILLQDNDRLTASIDLSLLENRSPTLDTLRMMSPLARRAPLSVFLFTQFLRNEGVADASVDREVLVAYLEYKSAYNLFCEAPSRRIFGTFEIADEFLRQAMISPVLEKSDARSQNADVNFIASWRKIKDLRSDIQKSLDEMPFCVLLRYGDVRRLTEGKKYREALDLAESFVERAALDPDLSELLTPTSGHKLTIDDIKKDIEFLKARVSQASP